jgi:hypothetical protein
MLRILDWTRVFEEAGLLPNEALAVRARAAFEGGPDQLGGLTGQGAAEVRYLTESFVNGSLPGQAARLADWRPVMGIRDFRLLDVF